MPHSWYNGRGKEAPSPLLPQNSFCHPNLLSDPVLSLWPNTLSLYIRLSPQETPAHNQDSSALKTCQPVLPIMRDYFEGSGFGRGHHRDSVLLSPWVK